MQSDLASAKIEAHHLAQQHLDVLVPGDNLADGRGDLGRREPGGRHLIQQRLKSVMVLAIDQRDLDRQTGQRLGSLQATEAAADDNDPRTCFLIHSHKL